MKKSTVVVALGALAQESRLDILRLLMQKGSEGLRAGEIGARLGLPSPTLSFHLNQLRFAGLVRSRRESRSIIYSANFQNDERPARLPDGELLRRPSGAMRSRCMRPASAFTIFVCEIKINYKN